MKRIEAIIKEENLDAVKTALDDAGYVAMTIFNCRARGTNGGINLEWRAGTYRVDFLHKILLMLIVNDNDVKTVIDIIINICKGDEHTGDVGKIFVSPIEEVISIGQDTHSPASS